MDAPKNPMALRQWKGLYTNADPHDLPPGYCQIQSNLQSISPGLARVRGGCRPVTFANSAAAIASSIIAMVSYNTANADWVVMQLADGTIRAGRGAT